MPINRKIGVGSVDFLIASGSTVFCSLITFVYNLYVKTYVAPYEFGIFTTATLVLLYLGYLQLGVLNSYNRDYPRILGTGDVRAAENLRNNVFTYIVVLYGIVALGGVSISVFLVKAGKISELLGAGLAMSSMNVGLTTLYNFLDSSAKSEGRITYTSIVLVIKSVLQIAVGIVAVRCWGYYGMLLAIMISAVSPFFFFRKSIASLQMFFDKATLLDLIKTGAPLLINSFIWTIMMSVDRFVILFFMTMTDLGVYSTALLGFSTLVLVPSSISQVFYIKMSKKYGETNDTDVLLQCADKFTFLVSLCTAMVSLAAYFGLPIIIGSFIPSYAAGIPAARILIVGVSLYSTTMMYSNVFSVLKLNAVLIKNSIILCIFNIVFSTAFVLIFGLQIENVAYGTALSYALYSIFMIMTLGKKAEKSAIEMLLISWLPVLCVICPCVISSMLFQSEWVALCVSFLLSAALALCLYGWFRHKFNKTL